MNDTQVPPGVRADLTAADRCDRCGAQAKVVVVMASGELLFCSHHARVFKDALSGSAVEIIDQSARFTD